MGGFDCCLFKKTERFPSSVKELLEECRKIMFKRSGENEDEFNSLWSNEDSSFRMFFSDGELWGVLDW